MSEIVEAMTNLMRTTLVANSPVLSGNMRSGIEIDAFDDHLSQVIINAPFYDMKEWRKTGRLVYTGATYKDTDITDYAYWVNKMGAFGTHNRSEGWVNRAVLEVVGVIAAQYNIPQENIIVKLKGGK